MNSRQQNLKREPTHPGELLPDVIDGLGMTVTDFSNAIEISRSMLYKIMSKEKPVSTETAVKLGALVGNGATLWLNMQRNYDLWHAEKKLRPVIKKLSRLHEKGC